MAEPPWEGISLGQEKEDKVNWVGMFWGEMRVEKEMKRICE